MKIKDYELRIAMPEGFELVGVKTEDDVVVIVCRPQESEVRTIGFATLDIADTEGEDDDE